MSSIAGDPDRPRRFAHEQGMRNTLSKLGIAHAAALVGVLLAGASPAAGQAGARAAIDPREGAMKIRIVTEGTTIFARLEKGAAARDFAAVLPVTLRDYARTEKVTDLPRRLSTEGAPPGYDPAVGDIAYYAPWGNLAIFYRDFGYSAGLVKLGTIASGAAALSRPGAAQARIEQVTD